MHPAPNFGVSDSGMPALSFTVKHISLRYTQIVTQIATVHW